MHINKLGEEKPISFAFQMVINILQVAHHFVYASIEF